MVRIAQGLVHMGKGTMSLNPYHRYEIKYLYRLSVRLAPSLAETLHYIKEQECCSVVAQHSQSTILYSVEFQPDWLVGILYIPVLQYSTIFNLI